MIFQKKYLLFIFSLLLCSHDLFAQLPSETAFAYPANIQVDGKLDDWKDIEKYPINQFPYGNNIQNKEDFEAFFQVAYSKELQELYFAVTIQDQENLLDQTNEASWNTQDTYNFYIDEKHNREGSGVILYTFNEVFETNNDLTKSWDKELREQKTAKWENIDKKIITEKGKKIIEFKIKLDRKLENGVAIGMDQMIVDVDTDENFEMITWTNSGGKSSHVGRLGTLILTDEQTKLVKIKGKIDWKVDTISVYPQKIRIYNLNQNSFWTNTLIDSLGNFEIQMPKGNYETELQTTLRACSSFYFFFLLAPLFMRFKIIAKYTNALAESTVFS
ncbi:hypothetical protein V9L05_03790 [Bernardetia sp. Wsw4-3y2]|uniref:hypothetical protein n=1 Tax=Bernardetia sp. Wsw4-3y2 TaxID=3127471 RepID=UPI0030CBF9B8